jgi:hypothetical protein
MSGQFMMDAMRALAAQFAAFEALLLTASAGHKLVKWSHSWNVVRQFAGVPSSLATPVLGAVVLCEFSAAVLLIVPASRAAGGACAAFIWTAYLVLILRAIVQGRRDADCGCSFGASARPLGAFQLTRNSLLAGAAIFVAVTSAGGSIAIQGSQVLAGCALLALYGALDQVMALQPLRNGETS